MASSEAWNLKPGTRCLLRGSCVSGTTLGLKVQPRMHGQPGAPQSLQPSGDRFLSSSLCR